MSAKKPPAEKIANIAPFGLRMLPSLRQLVEGAAVKTGRSLNAEITARLERTFDEDEVGKDTADFRRQIAALAAPTATLDVNDEAVQRAIVKAVKQALDETIKATETQSITIYDSRPAPSKRVRKSSK